MEATGASKGGKTLDEDQDDDFWFILLIINSVIVHLKLHTLLDLIVFEGDLVFIDHVGFLKSDFIRSAASVCWD